MADNNVTWQPLARRSARLGWVRLLVIADVLAAGAWIVGELALSGVRRWSTTHPVTVGFGVGAMLLVVTAFGLQRWLTAIESARWRMPARMALDAYVFSADRTVRMIYERALDLVRELCEVPRREPRLAEAVIMLLTHSLPHDHDSPVLRLARHARDEASDLSTTAALTSDMAARYRPFAWTIVVIAEQQQRLADVADRLNSLGLLLPGPVNADDERRRELVEGASEEVSRLVQEYLEVLSTMRLQVMEERAR